MPKQTRKEVLDLINPLPRNDQERSIHDKIANAWAARGKGALLGIQQYTAQEEAELRNPNFKGEPSDIDPRWIGSGPVSAIVYVAIGGNPGQQPTKSEQRRLAGDLQAAVSELDVTLIPWTMGVPKDHQLAR